MTAPALRSPFRIIKEAMVNAGYLQPGNDPDSEDLATYTGRLLDLINLWQTQGLKLWLEEDLTVPLVAGQRMYSLGPGGDVDMVKPTRVKEGYYQELSGTTRRPLIPLARQEDTTLSNVSQQGPINSYFVDKQQLTLDIYFWLTPDTQATTGEAHLIIQNQIVNFTNLTEVMNFPQEWFIALHWGLADEICTGQPQAIMDRCAQRAAAFRTALEDWDVEDADTRMHPDSRMSLHSGEFM